MNKDRPFRRTRIAGISPQTSAGCLLMHGNQVPLSEADVSDAGFFPHATPSIGRESLPGYDSRKRRCCRLSRRRVRSQFRGHSRTSITREKLHKRRRLDSQALSVCRCHAQASLAKMFLQNDLSVSARSLKAACAIVMFFGDPGMLVTEQCACEVRHFAARFGRRSGVRHPKQMR